MPRRPTCSTSWLFLDASEILCRSIHRGCSVRKGIFRNFTEFRTPVPESLFFFHGSACNFIKKETLAQVLSCEFCEISKNNVSTEHLWAIDSVFASFNGIQYCLSYLYSFCFILFNFIYLFIRFIIICYLCIFYFYLYIYLFYKFIYLLIFLIKFITTIAAKT